MTGWVQIHIHPTTQSLNNAQLLITQTKLTVEGLRRLVVSSETQNLVQHHEKNASTDYCLVVDTHSEYKDGELIFGQNQFGDVSDSANCVRFCFPLKVYAADRSSGYPEVYGPGAHSNARGIPGYTGVNFIDLRDSLDKNQALQEDLVLDWKVCKNRSLL